MQRSLLARIALLVIVVPIVFQLGGKLLARPEKVDTALIVVDWQVIYADKIPNGDLVARNIRSLVERAREASVPVIFVRVEAPVRTSAYDDHSAEFLLDGGLSVKPGDVEVFRKQASSPFISDTLRQVLEARSVSHLVICGQSSERGVKDTVKDALGRKYKVTVVKDAHSTTAIDYVQIIDGCNQTWAAQGVTVKPTKEVTFAKR